jgi:hypothetical protein
MTKPKTNRSGGPRTATGLAITANNALKTGAYSKQVVLLGEDAQQFAELEAQLVRDFDPVGMAEAAMVHDLAVLTWKKLRVDRVEHAVMTQMVLLPMPEERIQISFGPDFLTSAMPRLVPFVPATQAEFEEASVLIEQAQTVLAAPDSQLNPKTLQCKWPAVYEALCYWADDCALNVNELISGTSIDNSMPDLEDALEEIIATNQTVLWLWNNGERLAVAMQQAQDSRLLEYMKGNNNVTQRTFDDIGRAFYRTLAELRRQQDWRFRRNAVSVDDVTPKSAAPDADPTSTPG